MRYRNLLLTVLVAGISACAYDPPVDRATGSGCAGQMPVHSAYSPAPAAARMDVNLSPARPVRVQVYRLHAKPYRTRACGSVALRYELVLARQGEMVLREVREYYADDGTLVANNSEDVSEQLPASGRYTRLATLPVPAAAPVGRYRVVTKLLVKKPGDSRFIQLGRATTRFHVE